MSNKTIAKFSAFVISFLAVGLFFSACALVSSQSGKTPPFSHYGAPVVVGTIKSADITESSGIAASKCQKNVFWTHNDSGDDAFIFAINGAGDDLGTWKLPNARNIDWEDIATTKDSSGKCFVYIGEIGDNHKARAEKAIYRIPEPDVSTANRRSNRKDQFTTENAEILKFRYPDYIQDAETLMVHPASGDIYVVTKRVSGPAGIYKLKPVFDTGSTVTAEKIGDLAVPSIPNGFLTGGDISPDGKRAVICDYTGGYEFTLSDGTKNFDDIWKQTPETINIGDRKQGEGIAYTPDGTSLFATSEGKNSPVIEIKRIK